MIEKFDSETLKLLREEINIALGPLAKKLGLESIQVGGMSYEATKCTAKVEIVLATRASDPRVAQFAKMLGLPEDIIGTPFNHGKDVYEVVDLVFSKPKYPILAKSLSNGKRFGFTAEMVKQALNI